MSNDKTILVLTPSENSSENQSFRNKIGTVFEGTYQYVVDRNQVTSNIQGGAYDGIVAWLEADNGLFANTSNGLIKKVESGNTKIEYEYDVKDRVTQIKLNGDTKATIAYAEDVTASDGTSTDETTISNAKGETIKTTTDKAGNVRSVKFNDVEQWNATYTKNGEVKVIEDKITGKTEENYFDM